MLNDGSECDAESLACPVCTTIQGQAILHDGFDNYAGSFMDIKCERIEQARGWKAGQSQKVSLEIQGKAKILAWHGASLTFALPWVSAL